MIVVRRIVAVLIAPLIAVCFFVALLGGRVNATVLNPGFVLDRVERADLYTTFRNEGIPAIVDDYIEEQEERAPDEAGIDLPTDATSRARVAEVLQTFVPPDFLQSLTEDLVSEVIPYLTGQSDEFEVSISLHDPLVATFGSQSGEPSVFESAWLDLDMSEQLIRGFAEQAIAWEDGPRGPGEDDDEPAPLTPIEEQGLLQLMSRDIEGAADWWDEEFLGLIRDVQPYLVGESDEFDLSIDFSKYPEMAYAFAGPLQSEPEELQRSGWRFTDRDLAEKLAEAEDVTIEDIDRRLAIFRPEGMTFTQQDLEERLEQGREEAERNGERSFTLQEQRNAIRTARMAMTWGAGLATAALVLAFAFLGGRGWNGRLRWGSVALLSASVFALVLVTPVYAATASGWLDSRITDARGDEDSPLPAPVREHLFDEARDVVNDFVGGMQIRAFFWLVVAAIGIALSVAWKRPGFRDEVKRRLGRAPVVESPAS